MALQLKKAGFRLVRPLEGGLAAWRSSGLPIEEIPKEIDIAVIQTPLASATEATSPLE